MKKKNKVLLICILFCTFMLFIFSQNVFAADDPIEKLVEDIDGQITQPHADTAEPFEKVIKIILKLIRVAGGGIALIMVTITGIRYMLSSPGDKADYKKQLIPMAWGSILLFGASQLIAIIGNAAMNL